MNYVDEKIQQVVDSAVGLFGDNKTAFIMTSDHGMTNWGSHGSGSTDETETPIVAWGAGINNSSDPVDIEQADIAPLISTLLGISIPVNSEVKIQFFLYFFICHFLIEKQLFFSGKITISIPGL